MAAGTDREYPLEAEVPLDIGVEERHYETAGRRVYMDWNIVAGLLVVLLERVVERLDIVVESSPGNAHDGYHADGVLVTLGYGFLWAKSQLVGCQWHGAHLNLPKLGELLPYHLVGR